jgi:hypothetical protein
MSTPAVSFRGPVEAATWPEQLDARVTTPGTSPHLHGYDVEGDLAQHYRATELTLFTLTGELPTPGIARAAEIALAFLAPFSVAHAATHGAVVARLCGATTSATVGVSAVGLAEQARFLLDRHEGLLAWLETRDGDLPPDYRSPSALETASVQRLRTLLQPTGVDVSWFVWMPTRDAALLGVLHACGLRRRELLEALLVVARLPAVVAEAFAERPANFENYPTDLPAYRYEDPR